MTTMARAGGVWRRSIGLDLTLIAKQGNLLKYARSQLPNDNNDAFMEDGEEYLAFYAEGSPTGVETADYDVGHMFSIGQSGGVGGKAVCLTGSLASSEHKANGGEYVTEWHCAPHRPMPLLPSCCSCA